MDVGFTHDVALPFDEHFECSSLKMFCLSPVIVFNGYRAKLAVFHRIILRYYRIACSNSSFEEYFFVQLAPT